MKKRIANLIKFLICLMILGIILIGCEPISVSVNSKGEVAFTRSEGVFYIDLKSGKLNLLDWNFGKETIPVIVRWSPDEDHLAFTIKDNKDSQNTSLYITDVKGEKKTKIYSGSKAITQMEGAENHISLAQAGADSDMSVADLALISVKDGMSKIIVQNAGDVHKWLDDENIIYLKLNKKNPDNGDIFQGELSLYNIKTQKSEVLTNAIIPKTGALDCNKSMGIIVYTAIKSGDEVAEFDKNMTTNANIFVYSLKDKKTMKLSDDIVNFVEFSPDGSKILAKIKEGEYSSDMNLACFDIKNKKPTVLVSKVTDTVNANSANVQAYPTWLDKDTVLYWNLNNTYGSSGQSLQLMSIDTKTMKKKNHQVMIDSEILKLIESKGGF